MTTSPSSQTSRRENDPGSSGSEAVSPKAYRVLMAFVASTWLTMVVLALIGVNLYQSSRAQAEVQNEERLVAGQDGPGPNLIPVSSPSPTEKSPESMTPAEVLEMLDREAAEQARAMRELSAQLD